MSKYHVRYDYLHYGNVVMEGERIIAVVPDFRDAEYWSNALNKETAPLYETIATLQAALNEQSQALALARQNADAEMELFKRDEATIRELQERNARLLDMVNTKEAEKVELRKTIAQRDELLQTRDATLERYKKAMEEALRISRDNITDEHGNIKLGLTGLALIDMRYPLIDALQETDAASAEAPQESE